MPYPLGLRALLRCISVADRTHQHVVDLFKTIAPDGGCRNPVDIPGFDLLQDVRHRIRRGMVTLVHYDHAVALEQWMKDPFFAQRAHHGDVHDPDMLSCCP